MIDIKDKKDCCGCSACVQKCPKRCISLQEDNEGFLYPVVDKEICIDCGLCEKVCPVLHQNEPRKPLKVYAAINKNEEIRLQSSSGGIFTLLAEKTINDGGVVFGVRFDENWEVKHDYTETIEGLAAFRGSKYVQSWIDDNFKKAESFLKEGRKVLFSGTPCQIAGLKHYLRKEYDNLLTVDFICHGVPSPMAWRSYLSEVVRAKRETGKNLVSLSLNVMPFIKGITFRDKTNGWKKFGFRIHYVASKATQNMVSESTTEDIFLLEHYRKNVYMKAFLSNVSLRPSCYACPAKMQKSHSDVTLADLWICKDNIHLDKYNDDKGLSCVLINSKISEEFLMSAQLYEIELEDGLKANPCYFKSIKRPDNRECFWDSLLLSRNFILSTNKYGKQSFKERTRSFFIKLLIKLRIIGIVKLIVKR